MRGTRIQEEEREEGQTRGSQAGNLRSKSTQHYEFNRLVLRYTNGLIECICTRQRKIGAQGAEKREYMDECMCKCKSVRVSRDSVDLPAVGAATGGASAWTHTD
jgi:hypothetical protein